MWPGVKKCVTGCGRQRYRRVFTSGLRRDTVTSLEKLESDHPCDLSAVPVKLRPWDVRWIEIQ